MINNLSSIHPGARLAPGVVVDPFVTIEDNVEIGEGTLFRPISSISPSTHPLLT